MESASSRKPVVMAYIGKDDPLRGDSKAAIGLSRLVAEMIAGHYVYLDKAILDNNFPNTKDIAAQLREHIKTNGSPDIVIGHLDSYMTRTGERTPFSVECINEYLAEEVSGRLKSCGLVAHHLTPEILDQAGAEFAEQYPDIKGELIAIMLGGDVWESARVVSSTINRLKKIAQHYDQATLFVCPSRRTGDTYADVMHHLKRNLNRKKPLDHSLPGYKETFTSHAEPKIHVMGTDYETITSGGFNPYLGLLARAKHLVVIGESPSLISEALFTGKNIYGAHLDCTYTRLINRGYLVPVEDLSPQKKLPTKAMEPLNVSREIAESIVREYRIHIGNLTP